MKRKSKDDGDDEDSLRSCTREFHSVDEGREETRRKYTRHSDPRNGVKHSLERFPPKQPGQVARRMLDNTAHRHSLSSAWSSHRVSTPLQRHPLQDLPSFNQSSLRGACSVYRR